MGRVEMAGDWSFIKGQGVGGSSLLHRRYPGVERERERQPCTQFSVGTEHQRFHSFINSFIPLIHKAAVPNPWAMDWYQSFGLLGTG